MRFSLSCPYLPNDSSDDFPGTIGDWSNGPSDALAAPGGHCRDDTPTLVCDVLASCSRAAGSSTHPGHPLRHVGRPVTGHQSTPAFRSLHLHPQGVRKNRRGQFLSQSSDRSVSSIAKVNA